MFDNRFLLMFETRAPFATAGTMITWYTSQYNYSRYGRDKNIKVDNFSIFMVVCDIQSV